MSKRKLRGFWKEIDNVKAELATLERSLGHFPSSREISYHNSMCGASILLYHGGMRMVREVLGVPQARREKGYWGNWANVKKEIVLVCEELGKFPTFTELRTLNKSSLSKAIEEHGGINKVRKRVGYKENRKSPCHWSKKNNNLLEELNFLTKKLGHFPKSTELKNLGKGYLIKVIKREYGGYNEMRKFLAEDLIMGKWGDITYALKEVAEFLLENNLEEIPGRRKILKLGRNDIVAAIYRHYEGFPNFREKFREYRNQPSQREQVESLLEEWIHE